MSFNVIITFTPVGLRVSLHTPDGKSQKLWQNTTRTGRTWRFAQINVKPHHEDYHVSLYRKGIRKCSVFTTIHILRFLRELTLSTA